MRTLARAKAGEERQRDILKRSDEKKKKLEFDDFRHRRLQQVVEKEEEDVKAQEALEGAIESNKHKVRVWRKSYWSDHANKLAEEAALSTAALHDESVQEYNTSLNSLHDEFRDRDLAKAQMQVSTYSLSDSIDLPGRSLGVFGVPMTMGEFAASESLGGGEISGLDGSDSFLFDSYPSTEYESKYIDFTDTDAQLSKEQSLYDALIVEVKDLNEAIERMCEIRNMHERDMTMVKTEIQLTAHNQLSPLRRYPNTYEIEQTNINKNRLNQLNQLIDEVQYSIDVADRRKREAEAQMLTIAQKIAVIREQTDEMSGKLNSVNNGLGMLPVIIGSNISKSMGPFARPKEMMSAIVHSSKLMTFKEKEVRLTKAHKVRHTIPNTYIALTWRQP